MSNTSMSTILMGNKCLRSLKLSTKYILQLTLLANCNARAWDVLPFFSSKGASIDFYAYCFREHALNIVLDHEARFQSIYRVRGLRWLNEWIIARFEPTHLGANGGKEVSEIILLKTYLHSWGNSTLNLLRPKPVTRRKRLTHSISP